MKQKVIDLFAGCGGFSTGFIQAGFEITKAVEYDKMIAKSYKENHPHTKMFAEDIGNVDNEQFFKKGEADLIIGGPPCQGFSMAGARIRKNGFQEDPRNYLFKHYLNIVKIVSPKYFIFENVKGILTRSNGEIFKEIIKAFSNSDNFNGDKYYISYKIVKAIEVGIPQKRERVIIFGSKNKDIDFNFFYHQAYEKLKIERPDFLKDVTVWEAISNLPEANDNGKIKNPKSKTNYQKYLETDLETINNHTKTNHSKKSLERMAKIKSGENWTSLNEKINSVHSGAYGRLSKNEPAPTITTRFDTPSGGRFIHPVKNRTLTPREAARIQSFPDNFNFIGSKSSICTQIGNAVPPKLAFFIACIIKEIENEKNG